MRSLCLIITSTFFFSAAYAQICTPDTTVAQAGIYPASNSIPCIVDGQAFNTSLTIKAYDTIYSGGLLYAVNSITIDSITNLPCGITWESNNAPGNTYYPDELGCIQLSGTTNDSAGQYLLNVYVNVLGLLDGIIPEELSESIPQAIYLRVIVSSGANCPVVDTTVAGNKSSCSNNSGKNLSLCVDTSVTYLERATEIYDYPADTGYIIGTNLITQEVGDYYIIAQGKLTGVFIWFGSKNIVGPNDSFNVYVYNINPIDTLPIGAPMDSAKIAGSDIDTAFNTNPFNWNYVVFPHTPTVTGYYAIVVQTYYGVGINVGDTISILGNNQGDGSNDPGAIMFAGNDIWYHLGDVWDDGGVPYDVDAMMFPVLNQSFYAAATSLQSATCPGSLINLNATAFSCSGIASYLWSGPGINNPYDETTTAVVPLNQTDSATYSVMVIDSANDTLIKSVTIPVNNISVTAGNDTTIPCGDSIVLYAVVSGHAGEGCTIQWQNGPSSLNYPFVGAGTYTINISNSTGCTASASVTVSIPDGQVASFTLHTLSANGGDTITSSPCTNAVDTFVNTSNNLVNWSWTWEYTGGGQGFYPDLVTQAGAFASGETDNVILTGDSASCRVTTSLKFEARSCDSTNLVWPGDANDDGVVDYNDILQIALINGSTGPARSNPTIQWVGQYAANWDGITNGLNDKYGDCNGDGIVSFEDTLAVAQNYNLTHNKTGGPKPRATDPILSLVSESDSILPNTPFKMAIMLGNALNPVDSLYGLAFSMNFNAAIFDTGNIQLTTNSSWLGSNALAFRKVLTGNGQLVMVISATNQQDVIGGYGQIGELTLMAQPTLPYNPSNSFTLSPTILRGITYNESPRTFNVQTSQVSVISGINNMQMEQDISVYPNPNSGHFQLTMNEPSKQLTVQLLNIEGMTLYTEQLKDVPSVNKDYDFNTLAKGVYLLKLSNENGVVVKRLVVQ